MTLEMATRRYYDDAFYVESLYDGELHSVEVKRVHWSEDLEEIFYFVPSYSDRRRSRSFTERRGRSRSPKQRTLRRAKSTGNLTTNGFSEFSCVMVQRSLQFLTKGLTDLSIHYNSGDCKTNWGSLKQLYSMSERLKHEKGEWV